jgi:hypothetical protein
MATFDAIAQRFLAERRITDVFLKGRVTDIDTGVNPALYTVATGTGSRRMPMQSPAKIGDIVAYIDFVGDALGLGPFIVGVNAPGGGGGGAPGAVLFRSYINQALTGPVGTLEALGYNGAKPITRAQLDGILDAWCLSHGGTIRQVADSTQWNSACAAAVPGDLIRQVAPITAPIQARLNKYSMPGANMTQNGQAGLPIILTSANGIETTVSSITNGVPALDILNVSHVWAVGFNTAGSQFGIRCMNVDGTLDNPFRLAWCNVRDSGDAGIAVQGWGGLISSSGGTTPPGAGNEWGYSSNFVIESNYVLRPGRRNPGTGECIYLGQGSDPGWLGRVFNGWVRYNDLEQCTSDYTDIKPGCHDILVHDNIEHGGSFVLGSANQILYVGSGFSARPGWYNFDPNIWYIGNRSWDGNISHPNAGSSNYFATVSLAGVRFCFNAAWGFASGGLGLHLRSERPASESRVGSEKFVAANNLFWLARGVVNVGAPVASPVPFDSSWVDERNNLGSVDTTDGVGAVAPVGVFIAPDAIPAVGALGNAEWLSYGPGSAFDFHSQAEGPGGTSVADLILPINADISQRPIPLIPIAGPFQKQS